VYIPNLCEHPEFTRNSPVFNGENFRGYISFPLRAQDELKGILEVFYRSSAQLTDSWVGYLKSYAAQAAIAVSNSQLLVDLHQAYSDLQNTYDDTLAGWALALELREHETGQHTRRVQELTTHLASEIGFKGNDLVQIRRGALLHDIGKMAIPDKILLKPGPLDEEEWKVMRKHPEYAYDMLSHIAFLTPCLDIPYCHHEKWNGTGYPRGLRGDQIPLGARIFSVIDVWDALLSDRPYRKAWSQSDVVHYLEEESGTHFDPAILRLFINVIVK
jgi:putative nucleotidyltransferase with HDIG domain